MFTVLGSRRGINCDGFSRRDFLKVGALGLTGLLLPDLLRGRSVAASSSQRTHNTSVIWLWLSGGPTQLETFDPKPGNPSEFRSVVGSLQTSVPGIEIGGLFPEVAKHTDKLAIVRSFAHKQADHTAASHWVMTGRDHPPAGNGAPPVNPSLGSIVARHRGATDPRTGLPTYVTTDHLYADGPVWLGKAYTPFHVRGDAVSNMMPRIKQEHLSDRRGLLRAFDNFNRDLDRSGLVHGMDNFEGQALELIRGQAPAAFDIKREDPRLRDRYGPKLGENLLLARRLCEAGVGFVSVWYGGWDSHGTNPSVGHGTIEQEMHKLAPSFDRSVSALLEDIHERGLEKEILVVITGEFGRTPWLDRNSGGRDHWPHLGTLALSGGGLKMGQIVGQSSAKADVPKSTPLNPQDLMATVFHVLGMPQDLTYQDQSGRPVAMIEHGKPISELI
jgi:Protein of unknown function (DUF1501)